MAADLRHISNKNYKIKSVLTCVVWRHWYHHIKICIQERFVPPVMPQGIVVSGHRPLFVRSVMAQRVDTVVDIDPDTPPWWTSGVPLPKWQVLFVLFR